MSYRVSIQRYDPGTDSVPRMEDYVLDWDHIPSVLEALERIRDEYDATLAFRSSCGLGKCGACGISLNGRAVLACQTPLEEVSRIAPAPGYRVIRDLVVEREEYENSLRLRRIFRGNPEISKAALSPRSCPDRYQTLAQCNGCLICQASCPAFLRVPGDFPGPAVFSQLGRLFWLPGDAAERERTAWTDGIHNCTACMTCEQVCPRDAAPFSNAILPLRAAIEARNLTLPTAQEKMSAQFKLSGSLVPQGREKFAEIVRSHPVVNRESTRLLFMGCMFAEKHPHEGIALLDLIADSGYRVAVADDAACCGGPLSWVGHAGEAREALERNVRLIGSLNVSELWTPCPGCALTFDQVYRKSWKELQGREMPFKVRNIWEVLESRLPAAGGKEEAVRVAYHSPCHGRKLEKPLLDFLNALTGVSLVDLSAQRSCCGGMCASSNPALALEMSAGIVGDAENAGAEVLLTSCVFCRDNLSRAARRNKNKLTVDHVLTFVGKRGTKLERR